MGAAASFGFSCRSNGLVFGYFGYLLAKGFTTASLVQSVMPLPTSPRKGSGGDGIKERDSTHRTL